jgi:hypothetical protein
MYAKFVIHFVHICRHSICIIDYLDILCTHFLEFQGDFISSRKRRIWPSILHTKNPQAVDKPVDNLGYICLINQMDLYPLYIQR